MGLLPALAWACALFTGAGLVHLAAGALLVRRFARRCATPALAGPLPGISLFKPLHGAEPLLEPALASACAQDYPKLQVVLGVQDPADPARAIAERLRARFPGRDIAVVVDDRAQGTNRKVANLMNMWPAARHEVVVIADSDVHAAPDTMRRIAAALAAPGVGLVTLLYAGRPVDRSLAARLGASAITHGFLPAALVARALGRQDALGATMALRRETLEAIGGFAALRDDLADDNLLGRLVRAQGLGIALATTVVATTVPERRLGELFAHELRWGRTIRSLAPLAYAASAVQYPLAWAIMAVLLSGIAAWAVALVALAWAGRAAAAWVVDAALRVAAPGMAAPAPLLLLPLRDLFSLAVLLASFGGNRVLWRGQVMRAGRLGVQRA
jgi:ceramide glucosyltransferase